MLYYLELLATSAKLKGESMGIFTTIPEVRSFAWKLEKIPSKKPGVIMHTMPNPSFVERIDGDYFYSSAISSQTGLAIEIKYLISDYVFELR